MKQRIAWIRQHLPEQNIKAVILSDPYSMMYFSGYTGGTGFVWISEKEYVILTDSRYTEQAAQETPDAKVMDVGSRGYAACIAQLVKEERIAAIGFEEQQIKYQTYQNLTKGLPGVVWKAASHFLMYPRRKKTAEEIELIARAEEIGDVAFSYICKVLKEGMTEAEIALELEVAMRKQGATGLSFDTIVASGENSSKPHAGFSDKKLMQGDLVTMDFGCIYKHYCSDMTRTVAVGAISAKQKQIYQVVLEAQMAAIEAIRPGKTCSEIDAIARSIIKQAGYGEYFGHGLGHSVGLFIHEEPRFSPSCNDVIEPDMVITVEPGIYLPGEGGVRIEDLIVVTEQGCRNLTHSPKELLVF